MLDNVLFLIREFLVVEEILNIRIISKGTLIESKEITNLSWTHEVNIPAILRIFPKLKNIVIGYPSGVANPLDPINITLSQFIEWFLSNGKVVRLSLSGVNVTECDMVNLETIQSLRPQTASLDLCGIGVPNHYLCGLLLLMKNIQSLRICKCPCFGDREANLMLSELQLLREVYFEELFELQSIDYAHVTTSIHELHVKKCPRLLHVIPNHYLIKCSFKQTALTGQYVEDIITRSASIQQFSVEECRNVQSVSVQSSSLLKLSLSRCILLEYFRGEFDVLSEIKLTQNYRLNHVDIIAPTLMALELPQLPSLNLLYVTSNRLNRLDLTGCLRLYQSICAIKAAGSDFAISIDCLNQGTALCRPNSVIESANRTSRKSHRRCFHHNQVSLCCPSLVIKDKFSFIFPMQSFDTVQKDVVEDANIMSLRRGSL